MIPYSENRKHLPMITGLILSLVIVSSVGISFGHGGKTHAEEPFSAFEAVQKAVPLYDRLIASGKLPGTWETALTAVLVNVRETENGKETVVQFLGDKKSPFSSVALVQIFGNETLVSAFVTDTHDNGDYTVFVPTGPNPTSGNIYHVKSRFVHPVDVPVEEAMRSIISCGAGSAGLISAYAND